MLADNIETVRGAHLVHHYQPDALVEANRAVNWMEPRIGISGTMIVSGVSEVILLRLADRRWGRDHPKIITALYLSSASTHSVAFGRNVKVNADYARAARYYWGH